MRNIVDGLTVSAAAPVLESVSRMKLNRFFMVTKKCLIISLMQILHDNLDGRLIENWPNHVVPV